MSDHITFLTLTAEGACIRYSNPAPEFPGVDGAPVESAFNELRDHMLADRIPPGSLLMIESIDRIARDDIRQVLFGLMDLRNAGLRICTPQGELDADRTADLMTRMMAVTSAVTAMWSATIARRIRRERQLASRRARQMS